MTIGSLLDEDQALLADLGFLPGSESSDEDVSTTGPSRSAPVRTIARNEAHVRGAPWFEEIVRNTRLGRFKQQRGAHSDNGIRVEWEVTEWTGADGSDDEGSSATPSKRKIGEVDRDENARMSGI